MESALTITVNARQRTRQIQVIALKILRPVLVMPRVKTLMPARQDIAALTAVLAAVLAALQHALTMGRAKVILKNSATAVDIAKTMARVRQQTTPNPDIAVISNLLSSVAIGTPLQHVFLQL